MNYECSFLQMNQTSQLYTYNHVHDATKITMSPTFMFCE
jgi:hypothetical protein